MKGNIHYATVCYFVMQARTPDEKSLVYLAVKGQKIGKGCRNSYGGHVENGETPRQCTAREVRVESGGVIVDPTKLRYVALGEFVNNHDDGTKTTYNVNFFIAEEWTGEFIDTPEMFDGKWYPIDNLPIHELMPADREWLPTVLRNNVNFERTAQCYLIEAVYGPRQESLLQPVIVTPNRQLEIN